MNDTINQVGAGAPAERLRAALAGMLAIIDDSQGVAGYHLNGAIAEWDEFPEVAEAREALVMLTAAPAAPVVQAEQYGSYVTTPGESVAGIALRQLGDESRWIEIRDLNAQAFPDMGPHDYYPVGTKLVMPKSAPPAQPDASVLVEALRHLLSDDDIRRLRRFQEICEDSDAGGHDLPKEAVRRLERAGALRSCGFGRHETTLFGDAILVALAGKEGAQ